VYDAFSPNQGVSKMTKAEIVAKMAKDAGTPKTKAEKALNSFVDAVTTSLKKGKTVTLVGFGTFTVSKRKARVGRNPQTGAALKIAAAKVPKFRAGKALKHAVKKG
jgi:DNA-binding protein HU-beta